MFINTKSVGVRRLSLILGLISGIIFIITQHTPIYEGQYKLYWNLLNMAILFVVGFFAAWTAVRIIAWIVIGFMHDRSSKTKI